MEKIDTLEGINVLSLFDGISCGQIVLEKLEVKVKNYFASEIDKNSIKVAKHNYPNTKHIGDVKYINGKDLPKIDLLIGGFPCQSFSFAGKQLNFDDPRGKLFFELLRIYKETKPKYFLFENVKMKKSSQDIISNLLGVEPILINSNLVSAQNRKRLYWTNIPNIELPNHKNILLNDILVDKADYNLSREEKIKAIDKSSSGILEVNDDIVIIEATNKKKVYIDLTKQPPFTFYETRTQAGKDARRKIRKESGKDSTPRSKDYKMYLPLKEQKANCLVTVDSPLNYIIDNSWNYRRLYRIEMERLQTVPDNYCEVLSDSQARKAIGNGWTIDIISHIINKIPEISKIKQWHIK